MLVRRPAMAGVDLSVVFSAIYFVAVWIHLRLRCRYLLRSAVRLRLGAHMSSRKASERLRAVTRQQDVCAVVHSLWILFATIVMLLACLQQYDVMVRLGGGLLFCQDLERVSHDDSCAKTMC